MTLARHKHPYWRWRVCEDGQSVALFSDYGTARRYVSAQPRRKRGIFKRIKEMLKK